MNIDIKIIDPPDQTFSNIFWIFQEGRTPLHYAAALQGTTGGHNTLYNLLVEAGASEDVVDVVGQQFLKKYDIS